MTCVSSEPDSSSAAARLKRRELTALEWPDSLTRSSPSLSRHRRMEPSAWPTARLSPSGASSSAVTSDELPSGCSRCVAVPCLMFQTITLSSAGAIARRPDGSMAMWPLPETTTPHEALGE
eukprot:1442593-Prymnesium_polylepis.1